MRSIVISKLASIGQADACIICDLHKTFDHLEFLSHPDLIIFLANRYIKTGWNSDKKIIYYRRG